MAEFVFKEYPTNDETVEVAESRKRLTMFPHYQSEQDVTRAHMQCHL